MIVYGNVFQVPNWLVRGEEIGTSPQLCGPGWNGIFIIMRCIYNKYMNKEQAYCLGMNIVILFRVFWHELKIYANNNLFIV